MKEERIFHEALEQPAAERAEFLEKSCRGDAGLRERVEALLKANSVPDDFLIEPVRNCGSDATVDRPIAERPGQRIGRYRLLEKIGEGGFGIVFMAEQEQPVQRKVALKIIKPGMDTKEVIARFEVERQALALMDHPNIARVFDAGTTETGRPYFAMELVRGNPITTFCDQYSLTSHERLTLFIKVCRAVQHAHQKGIIHRDIKPSNILVTMHDDEPMPKVIDFGVAKATNAALTDRTLFTRFAQMIGTPLYMSPEQAQMSGLDIDTRSDIYSLGVLLYELLTGTTPCDEERIREAAYDEMLRIIREEDPPPPSLRISSLGETLRSIASHRKVAPNRLSTIVRGELDWIVMKSIEKDRSRRYETASALAEDVQHHLKDEPVTACPPSINYRFRKFARRNKGILSGTCLLLTTLLLGLFGTLWQAAQAEKEKRNTELALIAVSKERDRARDAELNAQKEANIARWHAYVADMNLAMQAWTENNVGRTLEILKRYARWDLRGFEWFYVWRQCQRTLEATQLPVPDKAHRVAFSPRGHLLAVAYAHGPVDLFDVVSRKRTVLSDQRRDEFYPFVAFSPNGHSIAYPEQEPTGVCVKDLLGDKEIVLSGHSGTVHDAAFSPDDRFLAVANGHDVTIWELASRQKIALSVENKAEFWSVAYSPDGKVIACGADDGSVSIWDLTTREPMDTPNGLLPNVIDKGIPRIWSLSFSDDGRFLAVGCGDGTVRLLNRLTGNLRILEGHLDEVRSVAFAPDSTILASASRDSTVKLWDLPEGQEREILKGYSFGGHACAFSPNGELVASAGVDYRVLLWNTRNHELQTNMFSRPVPENVTNGCNLAFLPSGQCVVSYANLMGDSISAWSPNDGKKRFTIEEPGRIMCFDVSNRSSVATGGEGWIHVWDCRNGDPVGPTALDVGSQSVSSLAFGGDGLQLVAGFSDGSSSVWNMQMIEQRIDISPPVLGHSRHDSPVTCISVSNDGKLIASGREDGQILIWDALTGKKLASVAHRDRVLCLQFSPTENLLASGALEHEQSLCLWDLSAPEPTAKVLMKARNVYAVDFSTDGKVLFAAHGDNRVRVWDVATGMQRLSLAGHTCAVQAVAISPDGNTLASADRYGTVRMWRGNR